MVQKFCSIASVTALNMRAVLGAGLAFVSSFRYSEQQCFVEPCPVRQLSSVGVGEGWEHMSTPKELEAHVPKCVCVCARARAVVSFKCLESLIAWHPL